MMRSAAPEGVSLRDAARLQGEEADAEQHRQGLPKHLPHTPDTARSQRDRKR